MKSRKLRKLFIELSNASYVCESGEVTGYNASLDFMDRLETAIDEIPSLQEQLADVPEFIAKNSHSFRSKFGVESGSYNFLFNEYGIQIENADTGLVDAVFWKEYNTWKQSIKGETK